MRSSESPIPPGYARIRAAGQESGALTTAEKALITAAAAAGAGKPSLVEPALARALDAGLEPAIARAVAPVLLLARGEEAYGVFTTALLALVGEPPQEVSPEPSFSREDALAYFRDYFGGPIPPRIALMADQASLAFEGYALLHRGALRGSVLPPKLAELVLCGVNAATFQPAFVEIHAEAARSVGATLAELVETVVATMPVSGVAAWATAAAGLERVFGPREPSD
jgi:4-carboxymuconolactone decarboxylase